MNLVRLSMGERYRRQSLAVEEELIQRFRLQDDEE